MSDEIEVTTAMVDAGQNVAGALNLLPHELCVIYRAMYGARPRPQPSCTGELAEIVERKGWVG